MIRFSCPECETSLKVADTKAGGTINCPGCQEAVKVPGGAAARKNGTAAKESRVRTTRAASTRPRDFDDEDDDRPAKKKSSAGLMIGIGVGAFLLVGGGVVALVATSKKPADNATAATGSNAGTPNPGGSPSPGAGSGDKKTEVVLTTDVKATQPPPPPPRGDGARVYQQVLKSVAFIYGIKPDMQWSGSGSLVDLENKLILTNYHVSSDGEATLFVCFPEYKRGELISEREHYTSEVARGNAIKAWVAMKFPKKDLALLKVDRVPPHIQPIPISPTYGKPGQRVHSVGSPGISEACWVYTSGTVRQVYNKKWIAGGGGQIYDLDARILETQSPTNFGDSGGPMVNDRGELVAVTEGGSATAQLTNYFIDVSEVRTALNSYYASIGSKKRIEEGPDPSAPVRDVNVLTRRLRESTEAGERARAAADLGKMGPSAKAAVPDLVNALKDSDDSVRRNAAEALDAIAAVTKAHVPALVEALKDANVDVRTFAASALFKAGAEAGAAVPALADSLAKDTEPKVRQFCAQALGKVGPGAKDAVPALAGALKDDDADVQVAAAVALVKIGPEAKAAVPALREALQGDGNKELRINVLKALEDLGPEAKAALPGLTRLLRDRDKDTRLAAVSAVGAVGPAAKDSVREVIRLFNDDDESVKNAAVEALGRIGKPAVPDLIKVLKDPNEKIRLGAAEALGQIGPDAKDAVDDLKQRQRDAYPPVKIAAAAAIKKILAK